MLSYVLSFLVAAVLLGVDQWSKFWTDSHLALGETAPFLGNLLELHYVRNYGVAWSLFSNMRWILVAVTGAIVLAVAAVIMLRMIRHPAGVFAAFLILSGGIGNLMDRIFLGYVVDMLHFPFWPSYPTFNVADICVVSGCVLWLIYALFLPDTMQVRGRRRERRDNAAADAAAGRGGTPAASTARAGTPSVANRAAAGGSANRDGTSSTVSAPRETPAGANDDWQEKWRRRQLERQGRR